MIEDVLVAEQKKHISCHQTGEAIYIFNRNSDQNTSRNLADEEVLELSKKNTIFVTKSVDDANCFYNSNRNTKRILVQFGCHLSDKYI